MPVTPKLLTRLLLCAALILPLASFAATDDDAPVITYLGDREFSAIDYSSLNVSAFSPRPGVPWLWVESLPEGAEFLDNGDGSRRFQWYPGPTQVGEHTVTFIAADAQDQTLQTRMDVTITVLSESFVSPAFSIVAPSYVEVLVGEALSVVIGTTDSDGSVPVLTGLSMPEGATLDDNGDGSRTFNWTPGADDVGEHQISFRARPANSPNWRSSHDMLVNVVSRDPVVSYPVSPGVIAGETMSFPVTVTKPSGTVPALMIDNLPGGASFTDNGDGSRQFTWPTTVDDIGSYIITIRALDPSTGASSSTDMSINVLPDPLLADGDQLILVSGSLESLDIENALIEEPFDDATSIMNADVGFLLAETVLVINGDDRRSIDLVPGNNSIVVESVEDSRRVLVNINRVSYLRELYPLLDVQSAAVDIEQDTFAMGNILYELQGSSVMTEQSIGTEMNVSYVTSVDISQGTLAMASRERPQVGVWLYEFISGIWQFDQQLEADPALFPEGMGSVVALDGDTLAVSAVYDSGSSAEGADYQPGAGAVLVYERVDGVWQHSATLRASNAEVGDNFGHSLALDGDTIVVGAIGEDSSGTGVNGDQSNNEYREDENSLNSAGAAYVFERQAGSWVQTAYLKPSSNVLPGLAFANAIAVSGDSIAVSALFAPRAGDEEAAKQLYATGGYTPDGYSLGYYRSGNVFLFERQESGWAETLRLSAPSDNWRFGLDVDVKQDQVLVLTQTQAYLHEREADDWQLIWNKDVGAAVVAFNEKAMVFGMLDKSSSVLLNTLPY